MVLGLRSYLSSQYAYTGSQSLVVSGANSGVTEEFPATPGNSYTASVYAMTPATNPLTGNAAGYLHLLFFDSSDNLISSYNCAEFDYRSHRLQRDGRPAGRQRGQSGVEPFLHDGRRAVERGLRRGASLESIPPGRCGRFGLLRRCRTWAGRRRSSNSLPAAFPTAARSP